MGFEHLTFEQQQMVREHVSPEEFFACAQDGMELTDEQLEMVCGGWSSEVISSDGSGSFATIDGMKTFGSPESILAVVKRNGIELSDEQVTQMSGNWSATRCPNCGSTELMGIGKDKYHCRKCDTVFQA